MTTKQKPLPPILSLYKPSRDWSTVLRNLAELFADPRRHLKGHTLDMPHREARRCCALGGISLLASGYDVEWKTRMKLRRRLGGEIPTLNDSRDGRRKILAGIARALEEKP